MATQANRKQAKERANEKGKYFCNIFFRSGGEENERQKSNNVNAKDEFVIVTW